MSNKKLKNNPNLIGISGKIGSGKDTVGKILQFIDAKYSNKEMLDALTKGGDYDLLPMTDETNIKIKKFADKLKDIVCLLIGCTRKQLEDRDFKEKELGEEWWQYGLIRENTRKPILYPSKKGDIEKQLKVFNNAKMYINKLTPRKLLQLLGTESGREIIHPNIWVNALFADYKLDNGVVVEPISEENKAKYPVGFAPDKQQYFRDSQFPNWIITDCRFPNEAQAIKDRGGIVIRVNRGKQCGSCESTFTKGSECPNCRSGNWVHGNIDSTHPSETALDDYEFDHVIDNNGSIGELVEKVKQLNLEDKDKALHIGGVIERFTIDDAKEMVKAWESLQEGDYDSDIISDWLMDDMKPVIDKFRAKINAL